MEEETSFLGKVLLCLSLVVALGTSCPVRGQVSSSKFEVDPTWPKPLPDKWVTGQVSGVCVDARDHVFIVNRNNMTDKEAEVAQQIFEWLQAALGAVVFLHCFHCAEFQVGLAASFGG